MRPLAIRFLHAAKVSPDEVRVQVARVGFDDETGANYVLLLDESESRMLPIMIGESEATAILLSLHGIKPERPFTHDLMRSIIGQTGNRVDRIEIADMHDEIYYATIYHGRRPLHDRQPAQRRDRAGDEHERADLREQQTLRIGARDRARPRRKNSRHCARARPDR